MEGYVLYPLEARPDEAADFYRERQEWIIAILTEHRLTPIQRVIGVFVMMHMSAQTGQCNPALPRIAAWLGIAETTVRKALQDIKALGYWDYPENKGGTGKSHQFTFLVTPHQAGGLSNKPPSQPGGSKKKSKTPNPPAPEFKPPSATSRTPQPHCAEPPSQPGGNYLSNSKTELLIEQRAFASQTTPMLESGSKLEEAKEEASKRTSDGESLASLFAPSEGLTRLEFKKRKLGPELSVIVSRSQIDYRERDGKLYIATSSADDAKAVTDNEQVVIDALRPDFPFACGIHAWVAS